LRKAWPLIVVAVVLSLAAGAAGAMAYRELGDKPGACDAERLAIKVQPSLVAISSTAQPFTGNGVIIQPDGLILTHAASLPSDGAPRVQLPNGTSVVATVIGTDPISDLAVIKVDQNQLPATPLSWSEAVTLGEPLVAFSSPLAPGATIPSGRVGATNETLQIRSDTSVIVLPDLIRIDAPLGTALDGGAVMNCDGQLVGIATTVGPATYGPGGNTADGYVISAAYARRISQALINHQTPTHPWFGLSVAPVGTDLAARYRTAAGLYVAAVEAGQPAQQAGILAGDVITAVNGRTANPTSWSQLLLTVSVGEQVRIDLVRNGAPQQVTVTVAEASVSR
jgi:putative serine protease PepD